MGTNAATSLSAVIGILLLAAPAPCPTRIIYIDVDPAFVQPGRWADGNQPAQSGDPRDLTARWIEGESGRRMKFIDNP